MVYRQSRSILTYGNSISAAAGALVIFYGLPPIAIDVDEIAWSPSRIYYNYMRLESLVFSAQCDRYHQQAFTADRKQNVVEIRVVETLQVPAPYFSQ